MTDADGLRHSMLSMPVFVRYKQRFQKVLIDMMHVERTEQLQPMSMTFVAVFFCGVYVSSGANSSKFL